MTGRAASGCYGLRLDGVDDAADLLVDVAESSPRLTISCQTVDATSPPAQRVTGERAELRLQTGGWLDVQRRPGRAVYHLESARAAADLVHPYLPPAAALAGRWLGRESFHAGAVLVDGGAWAVMGEKGAGKSTTLAWLARLGFPVLADDLVVLDGCEVFAGPRCIDLREDAAARFDGVAPMGHVGARERWRLALGPVPASAPLRGWIVLGWGDAPSLEPIRGAQRLAVLAGQRTLSLRSTRPEAVLELSALPVLRFVRPRGWKSLPEAADRLLERIAA
jgi:hypothetical protein